MKPGLLTFDGYPSPKALAPEESKELLTAVVAPSPAHSHGFLNSGLSSSLSGPIFTCLSLGTVLHVIGITTTAWSSKWRYREGLWESCTCDSQKEGAGMWDWKKKRVASMPILTGGCCYDEKVHARNTETRELSSRQPYH